MIDVRRETVGAAGEHRSGTGDVEHHAGPDDARAERTRRGVPGSGDHRRPGRQAEGLCQRSMDLADDVPWGDDPRQLLAVETERATERVRPFAGLGLRRAGEVEERVVDEGVFGAKSRKAAGNISGRRDELGDAREIGRPLVPPPQHLRAVGAGRRATGEARHEIAVFRHPVDIGLTAHVEPRIEPRRRREVVRDRANACHLAVETDRGDVSRCGARLGEDAADSLRRGADEVVLVLLDHPRAGYEIGTSTLASASSVPSGS